VAVCSGGKGVRKPEVRACGSIQVQRSSSSGEKNRAAVCGIQRGAVGNRAHGSGAVAVKRRWQRSAQRVRIEPIPNHQQMCGVWCGGSV